MKYLKILLILFFAFSLSTCEKEKLTEEDLGLKNDNSIRVENIMEFKSGIIKLTNEDINNYFININRKDSNIKFKNSFLNSRTIKIGDIIVYDKYSKNKPNAKGIMFKIKSIEKNEDEIVFYYEIAKINETFHKLELFGGISDEDSDIVNTRDVKEVSFTKSTWSFPEIDYYKTPLGGGHTLNTKYGAGFGAVLKIEYDDNKELIKIGFDRIETGINAEALLSMNETNPRTFNYPEESKELLGAIGKGISFPPPFNFAFVNVGLKIQAFAKISGGISAKFGLNLGYSMYAVKNNNSDKWETEIKLIENSTVFFPVKGELTVEGSAELGVTLTPSIGFYLGAAIPGSGGTGAGMKFTTEITPAIFVSGSKNLIDNEKKVDCGIRVGITPTITLEAVSFDEYNIEFFTAEIGDFVTSFPFDVCSGEALCDKNIYGEEHFKVFCYEAGLAGNPGDNLLQLEFRFEETTGVGTEYNVEINDKLIIGLDGNPRNFAYNELQVVPASAGIKYSDNLNIRILDKHNKNCILPFQLSKIDFYEVCGGSCDVDDNTDSNPSYGVVRIGDQYWMNENLKNSKTGYDFNNERLYTFYQALDIDKNELSNYIEVYDNTGKEEKKGLCPNGYHIPTIEEWNILLDIATPGAANKLKTKDNILWNGEGTNIYSFCAVPTGYLLVENNKIDTLDFGASTVFWTSTPVPNKLGAFYAIRLNLGESNVLIANDIASLAYSCRCIKN